MALHVLGHVEADQLDAQDEGELLGDLGLADAGGAGEQEGADRLVRLAQAGARQLDRRRQRVDRLVLAEHDALQVAVEVLQRVAVVGRTDLLAGMRAILATISSTSARVDRLLALVLRQDALRRAGLVDHVDRLVRQVAVVDVLGRQLGRGLQRLVGVLDAVVLLEARLQALRISTVSSTDGSTTSIFWKRRDSAWSFSKMPRYSVKVVAPMQLAARPIASAGLSRLDASSVPPDGRAGADEGVDLVDEQDRVRACPSAA